MSIVSLNTETSNIFLCISGIFDTPDFGRKTIIFLKAPHMKNVDWDLFRKSEAGNVEKMTFNVKIRRNE